MNSFHPSSTAGDGRTIDQSRYIKKSDKLDKIIECSQCGFPVDLSKRSTGASLGAIGPANQKTGSGTPPKPGIAFTDVYADPVDTNSGCPFCNSMNPQGKGRHSDPFFSNVKNLENL